MRAPLSEEATPSLGREALQAPKLEIASGHKWYALGVLIVVGVFNYIDRLSIFILQVQIKDEMGLTDTQLGLLTGVAFSLVYCFLAIPIARLADRGVRKNVIAASLVVWSIMTALCGFATGFVSLAILRMGVAIGEAGATPASHAMVSDYFKKDQRATALALWSLSLPIGQVLGFGLSGWLGAEFGWRTAFLMLGLTGLLVAPLVFFTVKEPRRGATDEQTGAVAEAAPSLKDALRILWKVRSLRHVILGAALNSYVIYVVINWNAPFYNRVHGLPMAEAAGYLALISGVGVGLGMILGGVAADRLGSVDPRWRMRVPLIGALGMAPLVVAQYMAGSAHVSFAIGLFTFMLSHAFYAPVVACTQSLAPANMRAFAGSILILGFNFFGMSLGPVVTGFISDHLTNNYGMAKDGLRYAISASVVFALWAAYHYWRAAKLLPHDLEVGSRSQGGALPSGPYQKMDA